MTSLIIGNGEIGKALFKVLSPYHKTYIRDSQEIDLKEKIEMLHICFPYNPEFVSQVKKYRRQYNPRYIVIHSTVPIGTTKLCGCFHSPVNGVHPNLVKGLKTFVKYLAPKNKIVENYFKKAKLKMKSVANSRDTEAAKLFCTTYYGWNIVFEKLVYQFCGQKKLNFETVYTNWNNDYNTGYEKLGMSHVKRPVLKHVPGKIGGHCVIPNLNLFSNAITLFIKRENQGY